MKKVVPGRYRHYQGEEYQVIVSNCMNSETLEVSVVYQALYGNYQVWNRSREMFMGTVEVGGKIVPRFKLVEEYK